MGKRCATATPKAELCRYSTASTLMHTDRLTGLRLNDIGIGEEHDLSCDGVCINMGHAPATELFRDKLKPDKSSYIVAE